MGLLMEPEEQLVFNDSGQVRSNHGALSSRATVPNLQIAYRTWATEGRVPGVHDERQGPAPTVQRCRRTYGVLGSAPVEAAGLTAARAEGGVSKTCSCVRIMRRGD